MSEGSQQQSSIRVSFTTLRTPRTRSKLPRPLVDALCGAFGEVCQICVLYPLETIKVGVLGVHRPCCTLQAG